MNVIFVMLENLTVFVNWCNREKHELNVISRTSPVADLQQNMVNISQKEKMRWLKKYNLQSKVVFSNKKKKTQFRW